MIAAGQFNSDFEGFTGLGVKNFTGFDSPYDAPENPELDILTEAMPPEDAADAIVAYLREAGFIRDGGL